MGDDVSRGRERSEREDVRRDVGDGKLCCFLRKSEGRFFQWNLEEVERVEWVFGWVEWGWVGCEGGERGRSTERERGKQAVTKRGEGGQGGGEGTSSVLLN